MMSEAAKEEKSKKVYRTTAIISVIAYILLFLTILQLSVMGATLEGNLIVKFFKAFLAVFIYPGNLAYVSKTTVIMLIGGSVVGGLLLFIVVMEAKTKKHDNPDTVNGEAHFMTSEESKAYNMAKTAPYGKVTYDSFENMILSKEMRIGMNGWKTKRNCNVLCIGGSGAGKSRYFAAPNILQMNSNFVITDPSGELLDKYGKTLEDYGYNVKIFNIKDVYKGNRYNPFHYIREEQDVFVMVNTLIKNTTPSDGHGGDPFWENSEKLLITALSLYLWHSFPEEQQTFENVVMLLNLAQIDEQNANKVSDLDKLFLALEDEDPENLAVQQYKLFKQGAGKTLRSIIISVGVRLQSFTLQTIKYLTAKDEMEFEKFSDTKQALFVIIPTADTTFNFIVSMMYSQLFMTLYDYAESKAGYGSAIKTSLGENIRVFHAENKKEVDFAKENAKSYFNKVKKGLQVRENNHKNLWEVVYEDDVLGWRGSKEWAEQLKAEIENGFIQQCYKLTCPNHVRLILDEFANIGQLPDFNEKLATMRKYNISCSIILQAISQLKDIYQDKWNTIAGNCDEKIFLGCNELETCKWFSEQLGKRTTVVANMSYQGNGNETVSLNRSSIELMTVDQLLMMDDNACLVMVRGVRPHYGDKYKLENHPFYQYAVEHEDKFVYPGNDNEGEHTNMPLWKRQKLRRERMAEKRMQSESEQTVVPMPLEMPFEEPQVIPETTSDAPFEEAMLLPFTENSTDDVVKEEPRKQESIEVDTSKLNQVLGTALGVTVKTEVKKEVQKAKNTVKQEKARKAQKNLLEMEQEKDNEMIEREMEMFMMSAGLNTASTDADIIKAADDLLMLNLENTSGFTFGMTD